MNQLFQNVLTASFHGSVVIAVVIVLRLILKKTPKKFICLLWLLAGIRLLMPFEIQSSLSLQPEAASVVEQHWQQEQRQAYTPAPEEPVLNAVPEPEAPALTAVDVPAAMPEEASRIRGDAPAAAPVREDNPAVDWAALVPYFWFAVACCFVVSSLYSYLRLCYQVREAVKIPGGWECENIETAFILGFIRPRIYIPMGMSADNRKYILAHERTHLEKGDHWFKMIGYIALAIHWFNPLVWVAYTLLCKDIEMACDERVVQFMELEERKAYSAALLSCSTNRAHFAACPVAFGEVSVKYRIKSVLNYRKPSFWISLVGVIAIVFVAVCLVTSPAKEKTEPAAGETLPPQAVEETGQTLPRQEAALKRIEDGLQAWLARDSYNVFVDAFLDDGSVTWQTNYYKRGADVQWQVTDTDWVTTGHMILDGVDYTYENNRWITADPAEDPLETWLSWFRWEDMALYNLTESTITNEYGDTYEEIAFTAYRMPDVKSAQAMCFTFNTDGELTGGTVKNADTDLGDNLGFGFFTPSEEEMNQRFSGAAEVSRTPEDYAAERMEVPSNHTEYDKDFMLGSGQMRWYFFNEAWQFALGAENASATGLTLKYCESGDDHQSLVAEEGFWLEKLVDGVWTVLEPDAEVTNAPAAAIRVSWYTEDRVSISWKDSYGALDRGFYRLGRYHTATMPSGETETIPCYAKFRVYDPNHDTLLNRSRSAIDALLGSGSYHLYSLNRLTEQNYDYYLSSEVWKAGPDYLEVTGYPLRKDTSQMKSVSGSLWRDGKYYGLEWSGEPAVSPVSSWWCGVDGYMDDSNFSMWSWDFQWYDAKVEDVYQDGNAIHILETYDFSDKYTHSEITLTFGGSGKLTGITKAYLPTLNCAEKDKVIGVEMVVYDTSAGDISRTIDSQNVSEPMAFSYEEDVKNTPKAKTSGFRNTTQKPVKTVAEAVALADKECAMPQILNFDNGYLQTRTYHDEAAGVWKVELFWWQHDTATTVYLNDQGITQRIVTIE